MLGNGDVTSSPVFLAIDEVYHFLLDFLLIGNKVAHEDMGWPVGKEKVYVNDPYHRKQSYDMVPMEDRHVFKPRFYNVPLLSGRSLRIPSQVSPIANRARARRLALGSI